MSKIEASDVKGVYGLDPAGYDPEKVAKLTDLQLCLEYHRQLELGASFQGTIITTPEECERIRAILQRRSYVADYLAYAICQRAQIPVRRPSRGYRLAPDVQLFQQWYTFYVRYYIELDTLQRAEFDRRSQLGADVSAFQPFGNWRDAKS